MLRFNYSLVLLVHVGKIKRGLITARGAHLGKLGISHARFAG